MKDVIANMEALAYLRTLPAESANCIVTSPPYYALRDYGVDGQIGLEETPEAFIEALVSVFREARRVLRDDGVCWVNMGDSYSGSHQTGGTNSIEKGKRYERMFDAPNIITGHPPKSRLFMPHRLALAMQLDGWIARDEIVWAKPNPMPESVTDRTTKAHEFVFMFSKQPRYWYDADAIKENLSREYKPGGNHGGLARRDEMKHSCIGNQRQGANVDLSSSTSRNRRSVWNVPTEPTPFAHFATFPQALIEPCILAGCPKDGTVLDMFMGSGTTALVARRLGRHYAGCEINPEYHALATARLQKDDHTLLVEQRTGYEQHTLWG